MVLRAVAAASAAAVLAGAAPSTAAGRCPQLADPRGDLPPVTTTTAPAALDLVEVSLSRAAGGTRVTFAVDDLPEAAPVVPGGYAYSLAFTVDGLSFLAFAGVSRFHESFELLRVRPYGPEGREGTTTEERWPARGTVDLGRDRVSIDLADGLAPVLRPGVRLEGFTARSWERLDSPGTSSADWGRDEVAGGSTRYVVGQPGCPPPR